MQWFEPIGVYFSPITRILETGKSALVQQPSHVRPASLQSYQASFVLTEGCHNSRHRIYVPGWTKRGKDSERDVYLFYHGNKIPLPAVTSHRPELCPMTSATAGQLGEGALSFSGVYSGREKGRRAWSYDCGGRLALRPPSIF